MIKVVPLRYLHYCFDTNTAATIETKAALANKKGADK